MMKHNDTLYNKEIRQQIKTRIDRPEHHISFFSSKERRDRNRADKEEKRDIDSVFELAKKLLATGSEEKSRSSRRHMTKGRHG